MWRQVSHHPSLRHWVCSYVLSSCQVSHHPSLSVFLCDVNSHTTLRWVMLSVLLCDVQSHTTLHQVKVIRNSEDCFPTSFDNLRQLPPRLVRVLSITGIKRNLGRFEPCWGRLEANLGCWAIWQTSEHCEASPSIHLEQIEQIHWRLKNLPHWRICQGQGPFGCPWMTYHDLPIWAKGQSSSCNWWVFHGFPLIFPWKVAMWPRKSACCHAWVRSWIAWRS